MKTNGTVRATILSLLAIQLVACDNEGTGTTPKPGGGDAPAPAPAPTGGAVSIARQITSANAAMDASLNLVARKYLNNETEVVSFYEPEPGHIMFVAAGRPVQGSQVDAAAIRGKPAAEVWAIVAPQEPMPQPLAEAVARVSSPMPDQTAPRATPLQITTVQESVTSPAVMVPGSFGPLGVPKANVAATAPVVDGLPVLQSGGYCSGQFWTDFASWGTGGRFRESKTFNYGWYEGSFTNITQGGYLVCPQGDVSGLGGRLAYSGQPSSGWAVPANTYLALAWPAASAKCGWDLFCGGDRCTPNYYNLDMTFYSSCFLNYGSSCGDNFDWVRYYNWWDSYCNVNGGSQCSRAGLRGCACAAGGTCDAGSVCFSNTCIACGGVGQSCCSGLTCAAGRVCQFSPPQNTFSCL